MEYKPEIRGTLYCRHSENDYTLMIEVENCGVQVTSDPWDIHIGNFSTISICDLTTKDMIELADKIRATAYDIEACLEPHKHTPTTEEIATETAEVIDGLTIKP